MASSAVLEEDSKADLPEPEPFIPCCDLNNSKIAREKVALKIVMAAPRAAAVDEYEHA